MKLSMVQLRRLVKEAVDETLGSSDNDLIRRHGNKLSPDLIASTMSDLALEGLDTVGYFEGFDDRVLDEKGEMIRDGISSILRQHMIAAVKEIMEEFG